MQNNDTLSICRAMLLNTHREWMPDEGFWEKILDDRDFEGAIIGSQSVYSPRLRTGFSSPLISWEGGLLPPASLARNRLQEAITASGKKRIINNKNAEHLIHLHHPLFFSPYEGDCLYIDLKAAHYSIYSRLPTQFFFNGDRMTWGMDFISDALPIDWKNFKQPRNCLAGLFHANKITRIKEGRYQTTICNPPTYSPSHWGFIQATLHWLAGKAIEYGALYVYADGYIFPFSAQWEKFQSFIEELGFESEIKAAGYGAIFGIGRYQIGGVRTKLISTLAPIDKILGFDNMEKNLNKLLSLRERKNQ